MNHLFETTFTTRGYELDRDGLVPPATLLRYFELVRWASLQAIAHLSALFRDGHAMVVVAQKLARLAELSQGIELLGSMSVGRIGRSSLDFDQQLRRASDGQIAARGVVTVVHLDHTGRPAPLPDAFRQQHPTGDEHPPPRPLRLEPLPSEPPPADEAFVRSLTVRPSDLDLLGHVNHANHLAYLDDTRIIAAESGAFGIHSERARGRVCAVAIDYDNQALQGDRLQVLARWMGDDQIGHDRAGDDQIGCWLSRASDGVALSRARITLSPG